ncbi:hypothetical protein AMECASPLE_011001 [Ameca splendens]|uniref:Target of Myb protein 1 n=1 Tax=Ameca splendens TaxID=208324 RepID=A0ABV0YMR5_9TELE
MEFFLGNPFSTPVGQRIEKATSGSLQSEDWGLNMEICDIINETDEGPRDAIKAIKKRIVGNKNFREIMLALTVLETCVKNCGHRFHVLVASQEFVEGVLVRSILPKYNPPTVLHDRVLSLIQSWADAFRSSPSLVGVVYVYDDLKRRGLEFPMTDLDALSPIHTPNRSIPENETPQVTSVAAPISLSQEQVPAPAPSQNTSSPVQVSNGPVPLTPEQEQKLRSELALVKGNLSVMSQMLNELIPGQSTADDAELLQQLFSVCKKMQSRVVELIPQLVDEGFMEELLVVNDDLNNAFIRYERFERLNKAQSTNTQQISARSPELIDVSPEPSTNKQPATITATSQPAVSTQANHQPSANHKEEEEFDMFAQTRGSSLAEQRKSVRYEDPETVEGLAEALDSRLQVTAGMVPEKNTLQNNVDKWLSSDLQEGQSSVCEGVSSEEFDKFLDDRAKAADHSNLSICKVVQKAAAQLLSDQLPNRTVDKSQEDMDWDSPFLQLRASLSSYAQSVRPYNLVTNAEAYDSNPKPRYHHPFRLFCRLESNFDPFWMSVDQPLEAASGSKPFSHSQLTALAKKFHQSSPDLREAEAIYLQKLEKEAADLNLSSLPSDVAELLRGWLVNSAMCKLHHQWFDLGPAFWPRWLRQTDCERSEKERSCSFPREMKCVRAHTAQIKNLAWICLEIRDGSKNLKGEKCDSTETETTKAVKMSMETGALSCGHLMYLFM